METLGQFVCFFFTGGLSKWKKRFCLVNSEVCLATFRARSASDPIEAMAAWQEILETYPRNSSQQLEEWAPRPQGKARSPQVGVLFACVVGLIGWLVGLLAVFLESPSDP